MFLSWPLLVGPPPLTETSPMSTTTGRRVFAEGLKPSAKALQPSAKDLPRAALGEEPSGKKTSAKDSLPRAFYRALGKVFAEG